MSRIPGLRRVFRLPLGRTGVEKDVGEELEFHIEALANELIEQGMDAEEARAAATGQFGDVDRIGEECHDIGQRRQRELGRADFLDAARQDLGFALRQLRRSPAYSLIAVLTLALGIGATTVIFSIVNAVVLQPLPFAEPDRLVRIRETTPQGSGFSVSDPTYLDWTERARSFTALGAMSPRSLALTGDGDPQALSALATTHTVLPLLGVSTVAGRTFLPEEDRPGGDPRVVVLSDRLWESRFGADPGIVGRTLTLDGELYAVIGIVPGEAPMLSGRDIFVPLAPDPVSDRSNQMIEALGRLAPGVSLDDARAEMAAIARQLGETYPETNEGWGAVVIPLSEWVVEPGVRRGAFVLLGAVTLLLLIACANVSNILIARATTRQREIGLRAALGAGRRRILRQLLTESLLLAALGAGAGLLIAFWAMPVARGLAPGEIPRLDQAGLDTTVLLFTLAVSVATSVVFGLAPALRATTASLRSALREGGPRVSRDRRLRDALVVAQLGLATMLLVGAGLMIRSFGRLQSVDTGFDPRGVVTVELQLPEARYSDEGRTAFFAEVLERVEGLPSVTAAGASMVNPFDAFNPRNFVAARDADPREQEDFTPVNWRGVTPGYFEAVGIRQVAGRSFEMSDGPEGEIPMVVSRGLAERLWAGEDPIGKRIVWNDPGGVDMTVVGVVSNVRDRDLEGPAEPTVYLPYRLVPWSDMSLAVRTAGNPSTVAGAIRRELQAMDPGLPIPSIRPLASSLSRAVERPRFNMQLLGVFAALALLLASIGIYGVTAFAVGQRTREIGVRVALGAEPGQILGMILRRALALVGIGLAVGLAGALALSGLLTSLLYETAATDPRTLAAVVLVLGVVAVVASYVPALRATAVDPKVAFSAE